MIDKREWRKELYKDIDHDKLNNIVNIYDCSLDKLDNIVEKNSKLCINDIIEKIKMQITKEINIAHSENQRTSRLTSLYMFISKL